MSAPTSRLVKRERSKIVKQSTMLIVLSIGLVLLFIFVILPAFIGIINSFFSTDPFPKESPIILQAPLLDAPVEATNSAELELTGYAAVGSAIHLLKNAREIQSTTTAGGDGRFAMPVTLDEGENTVALFAKKDETTSPNSQEFVILFDQETPKLIIDEPQPETHFDRKSRLITMKGLTDPGSQVYINGRLVMADQEGAFTASLSLGDNKNEIDITARDAAGNSINQKLVVYLDV